MLLTPRKSCKKELTTAIFVTSALFADIHTAQAGLKNFSLGFNLLEIYCDIRPPFVSGFRTSVNTSRMYL